MNKVKDINARHYYLALASETQCSREAITAQISSRAYKRKHLSKKKHNFHLTLPGTVASKAENVMKNSYLFEVVEPLGVTEKLAERVIERHRS